MLYMHYCVPKTSLPFIQGEHFCVIGHHPDVSSLPNTRRDLKGQTGALWASVQVFRRLLTLLMT
jgi:hypothetical protein